MPIQPQIRTATLKTNVNLKTTIQTKHNIGSSTMVSNTVEARVLGIPGDVGAIGPEGPAGVGADKNYVHIQGLASTSWNIKHDLNKFPAVTVLDSALNEVIGDIIYLDVNNVRLVFSAIFSGTATFN